jgi:hypothetical protein
MVVMAQPVISRLVMCRSCMMALPLLEIAFVRFARY